MFDAESKRAAIDLRFERDKHYPEDLWVSTDPSRLTQIIINLLANSIKFVGRMPVRQIRISIAKSDVPLQSNSQINRRPSYQHQSSSTSTYNLMTGPTATDPIYLIFKISDTGPGMSEEQVSSLFQRTLYVTFEQENELTATVGYFQASPKTHVEYGEHRPDLQE